MSSSQPVRITAITVSDSKRKSDLLGLVFHQRGTLLKRRAAGRADESSEGVLIRGLLRTSYFSASTEVKWSLEGTSAAWNTAKSPFFRLGFDWREKHRKKYGVYKIINVNEMGLESDVWMIFSEKELAVLILE
ncbi:hypothetical protein TNCV_3561071 [Trichonephila clavipes]|nr:hypothetical protein TNCV_3561071 [Trichonephila clavipes]